LVLFRAEANAITNPAGAYCANIGHEDFPLYGAPSCREPIMVKCTPTWLDLQKPSCAVVILVATNTKAHAADPDSTIRRIMPSRHVAATGVRKPIKL
jgi:hypothetical protein